jgi:FkbM family methyltransferase
MSSSPLARVKAFIWAWLEPLTYIPYHLLRLALGLRPELRIDGRGLPLDRSKRLQLSRYKLLKVLVPRVVVDDGGDQYVFLCPGWHQFKRAYRMLSREEGTVAWISGEARAGDVFYDIGANVGIFTLYAGRRVRPGVVYAFEPHLANAVSLLDNVRENGLHDVVKVFSCALSDHAGFFEFAYGDFRAGTSFSQLGERADEATRAARAESPELKFATTIDSLIDDGTIRPPDLVKIDVDGQELEILRGMEGLLRSGRAPRAIQVEVNVDERHDLTAFLAECGFELAERHHSVGIRTRIEAGQDPDQLPFNGIFRPRGGSATLAEAGQARRPAFS